MPAAVLPALPVCTCSSECWVHTLAEGMTMMLSMVMLLLMSANQSCRDGQEEKEQPSKQLEASAAARPCSMLTIGNILHPRSSSATTAIGSLRMRRH
jgi:hypothetical protein